MRLDFIELMKIADQASMNSKDQSTKVGCTFINKKTGFPAGYGYNGMPRGMSDMHTERNERPEKYKWIEHSERNTLYNIARETLEGSRILLLQFPTMESARAIVSSGIKEVITLKSDALINTIKVQEMKTDNGIWRDSPEIEKQRVKDLFEETGVVLKVIDESKELNAKDEKLLEHLKILKQVAKAQSSGTVLDAAALYKKNTTTPLTNGFGVSESFDLGEVIYNGQNLSYDKNELELEAAKAAIFNHIKIKLEDCVALPTWCPCIRCAVSMMKSGIKEIYTRELVLTDENDKRWEASFALSDALLPKMGIKFVKLPIPKITPEEFAAKTLKEDMEPKKRLKPKNGK